MKFFGMGGLEFVIIIAVVLIIFGPKNLPKLGKALGKTVSNLRAGMNDGKKKGENAAKAEQADDGAGQPGGDVVPVAALEDGTERRDEVGADAGQPAAAETEEAQSAQVGDGEPAKKTVKRVVLKKTTDEAD